MLFHAIIASLVFTLIACSTPPALNDDENDDDLASNEQPVNSAPVLTSTGALALRSIGWFYLTLLFPWVRSLVRELDLHGCV